MIITTFDAQHFVNEYWQKKPCLIRQFVANFEDPIDEHDLAGLAQEESADSRIVSNTKGKWHVQQGPFSDFSVFCVGDWSLLVQGVNNYIPEVDALSALVDFIPHWRFDDVMVSYSTANAGVGAHIDQYDVFILQGRGTRRWQVGLPGDLGEAEKSIHPHPLLKQIEGFEAVIDEVLQPGDAIYIPPLHPHCGVALESCLNYSLGFRAPTNFEVLSGILDEDEALEQIQTRYTDPNIQARRQHINSPMQVSRDELLMLKDSIMDLLSSPQAEHAMLQYLSRQGLVPDDELVPYSKRDVLDALDSELVLEKMPGVKPIFAEQEAAVFSFYIDGNVFTVPHHIRDYTLTLLASAYVPILPVGLKRGSGQQSSWVTLVTQLLNAGYWDMLDITTA